MSDPFRQWLSDVEPSKGSRYCGPLVDEGRGSDIEFDSSTLELLVDGAAIGFAGTHDATRSAAPIGLRVLGRQATQEPLARFFVHVNNYCNLRCTYCYEQDLPYHTIREEILSDAKAAEVCRFITAVSGGSDSVHITYFGGEPLLSFHVIQKFHQGLRASLNGKRCTAGIVTNGTILTDAHLAFLREHDFEVMVSFDGTRTNHECQRPGPNGVSTYDLIVANIGRLVAAKMRKVSIRITYGQASLDLLDSIKTVVAFGPDDVAFRPIMDGTPVNRWADAERHAGALHDVVRYYFEQLLERQPVIINNVHEVVRRILFRQPKTDYCEWGRICSITPDGDLYPCTHFVGMPEFRMGDTGSPEMDRTLQAELLEATRIGNLPCQSCSVKHVCGGGCRGCSQHVYADIFREDDYCEARRDITYAVIRQLAAAWRNGRWRESSAFVESLMGQGHRKHSCDRFS